MVGEPVIDEAHLLLLGEEINVMKHALGWPRMYRNHYCCEPDSYQCGIWVSLAKRGLAKEGDTFVGDDKYRLRSFSVTDLGAKALAYTLNDLSTLGEWAK